MGARPRGNNWFAYRQEDSGKAMRSAMPGAGGACLHVAGVDVDQAVPVFAWLPGARLMAAAVIKCYAR
jgi:hypothetical protein